MAILLNLVKSIKTLITRRSLFSKDNHDNNNLLYIELSTYLRLLSEMSG